jgi:hypothetical protein
MPKELVQNFYRADWAFCCFCTYFFVLLTLPSLFSYPYSYLLHFPSFSCATIHCSPSQLLFLPLLIHSLPIFASSSYPSPSCHQTTPPPCTLTTYWLDYCTKNTHPQTPAVPNTSTVHYNSRNTPKHTQGQQNPATILPHPPPPLSMLLLSITQISLSSQKTITPQLPLFIDIITKVFFI